jgi:hypothetical protein
MDEVIKGLSSEIVFYLYHFRVKLEILLDYDIKNIQEY